MLRILRTTSFRFTIAFVALFSVAVAALGAYLYSATFGAAARQTDEIIESEMKVLGDLFAESGPGALTRVIRQRIAWADDSIYMLIGAPSGALLAGNLTALPPEALTAEGDFFTFKFERPLVDAAGREVGVQQREARGRMLRFRTAPDAERSYLIVVARDVASREYLRARSRSVVTRIALVTIGFGVILGLMFSRTLLRRVDAVNKTALAIRGGDLSRRIPLSGSGDEIDHLSENLNSMLDQIERLMAGMREVSDNIAHDLRSPLTRIHNRLTDALSSGDNAVKEEALHATIADAERMLATFNALLSIARIGSGEGAGAMGPVDIAAIAEELTELYEPAAQDAGFALELNVTPVQPVLGSRELVSQALSNFLDNALKYAAGGGRIEVSVAPVKGGAALSVADDGPGVAPEHRDRILERFVRLEESRTTSGNGLGLSLVAAIARAHGGALRIEDGLPSDVSDHGCGLRMTLEFPTAKSR